jgi:imidazole glycerol-phosphate synthase subunit HisF
LLETRVIPCLLLRDDGLVKTVKFGEPKYVGDPINAVRIFNTKEVDELAFLDISATPAGRGPNFALIRSIASEAFMPMGYGGGITSCEQIERLLAIGVEKVILNSAAFSNPRLISDAANMTGSQAVVVSIDAKKAPQGKYSTHTHAGTRDVNVDPVAWAVEVEALGAGEILLTSIDRDGTQSGYDLDLIEQVAGAVSVPVIASGGAGSLADFRLAAQRGASAVAAGSLFVFHGKHRAVLITYPERKTLERQFDQ